MQSAKRTIPRNADLPQGTSPRQARKGHNMSSNDIPVFSINDLVEAYRNYEAAPAEKEAALYFVPELTGLSVDALAQLGCG